jgi:outer membrane immunogenic protein
MTHTILRVPQYWARRASSFLVAAAASLPASAFAADLAAPPPAFTWTGFYLGANAGGVLSPGNPAFQSQGFGSSAFDLPANGGAKVGFTGGFQAGYNYQIGSLVPGFETDFNYLGNCRDAYRGAPRGSSRQH